MNAFVLQKMDEQRQVCLLAFYFIFPAFHHFIFFSTGNKTVQELRREDEEDNMLDNLLLFFLSLFMLRAVQFLSPSSCSPISSGLPPLRTHLRCFPASAGISPLSSYLQTHLCCFLTSVGPSDCPQAIGGKKSGKSSDFGQFFLDFWALRNISTFSILPIREFGKISKSIWKIAHFSAFFSAFFRIFSAFFRIFSKSARAHSPPWFW